MKTRPANDRAIAKGANEIYHRNGVDWPVSGDETRRAYGYIGMRRTNTDLWTMPGVKPKIATTGIRVGDIIELFDGTQGEVTAVGTIAGWMKHGAWESRWQVEQVEHIYPAGKEQ